MRVLSDPSLLWYVNRAAGLVLLMLLTLATALGVAAVDRRTRPRTGPAGVRRSRPVGRLPGFVLPELHRRVSLVAVALAFLHVVPAVVDDYVPIGWLDVVVPFGASYHAFLLGLGALAFDVIAVALVTALLRTRIGPVSWKQLHRVVYLAWPLAVWHSIGIGTDSGGGAVFGQLVLVACVSAVLATMVVRLRAMLKADRAAAQRVSGTRPGR